MTPTAEVDVAAAAHPEGIDRPDQIGPAWDAALAADRPFVIEAITDPGVPLLPPHLEPDIAEQLHAAVRSEPDADRHEQQIRQQALDPDQTDRTATP